MTKRNGMCDVVKGSVMCCDVGGVDGVVCDVVWCGVVWCGVVWCGVVWCGVDIGSTCDAVE